MMTRPSLSSIAVILGTRPEAIKLMPVIRSLHGAGIAVGVYSTGQHRELLLPTLRELSIRVDEDLDLMRPNQSLTTLSARVLEGVRDLLERNRPSIALLQGDTTTVAMSALACFYLGIPVAHVEAGLRTHNPRNPFPEEMNRQLVSRLATIHFAPTDAARRNLLAEGVAAEAVHVVGNTVIDALHTARRELVPRLPPDELLERIHHEGRQLLLVTSHRRESFGADFFQICAGVRRLAIEMTDRVAIVYPVHLNPNVRVPATASLMGIPNVHLIEPLSYVSFVRWLERATLIITDSGGVQEEAAALGVPTLVTRRTCDRSEGLDAGVSELVGPDADRIVMCARAILSDPEEHRRRAVPTDVYGDGHTAQRIVRLLLDCGN
jgi:UDP-N-acetylglucosamine 2-epimerase (non-hydrolysing)